MFFDIRVLFSVVCIFYVTSIPSFLVYGYQADGTVIPTRNFKPQEDAKILNKAMGGVGTRDSALIDIVCKRTNQERQEIAKFYSNMFHRDLHKHVSSDTSGNYGNLMNDLMTPAIKYDCLLIEKAIKGFGTDFELLIEVLLTRNPIQLRALSQAYPTYTKRQLESDIKGDVRGDVEDLLVSLSKGLRDPTNKVDELLAKKDAQALYEAGIKKIGTDKHVFIDILSKRNYAHLLRVFENYEIIAKEGIEKSITSETTGKIQKALLLLVKCIRNPSMYFAEKLHIALKKGLLGGTDEKTLNRIFTTRAEVDMVQIIKNYRDLYKAELEAHLRRDVHGNYQSALLALLKGNRVLRK